MRDFTRYYRWELGWVEDSEYYGIAGQGMTTSPDGGYVEVEDYLELLEAYTKLKQITKE